MRLAVISPLNRCGCSVVTALIAQACATSQNMKTMVTYTSESRALPKYLNLGEYIEDKTRSISQVLKLIHARAIGPDELDDFAIKVSANCYIMDTVSPTITAEEALEVQKYVFKNMNADLTICDISEALDNPNTQELLTVADAICVVLNPDFISIDVFKVWLESEYWPKNKPYFVILNRYDDAIIGVRPYARLCGIPPKNLCKVHYNPFIVKSCNEYFLGDVVPYALVEKDVRVVQLYGDLKEIMSWITAQDGRRMKWEK